MPKLDIKEIKRNSIVTFNKKDSMLKYIKEFAFKDDDRIIVMRKGKEWVVWRA